MIGAQDLFIFVEAHMKEVLAAAMIYASSLVAPTIGVAAEESEPTPSKTDWLIAYTEDILDGRIKAILEIDGQIENELEFKIDPAVEGTRFATALRKQQRAVQKRYPGVSETVRAIYDGMETSVFSAYANEYDIICQASEFERPLLCRGREVWQNMSTNDNH
jgi:hypothetical protein